MSNDFPPGGRVFTGPQLAQIAFPLGGIGTGTVSLGGRGDLRDWEINNRPAKGAILDGTICALRIDDGAGASACRVLEREYFPPFNHALGFDNFRAPGLPRFREATFKGEYPFAEISFEDDAFPADVSLEAFNPLAPANVEDSSIPGLILRYRVKNTGKRRVSASLLATMQNPIGAHLRMQEFYGFGVDYGRLTPPPELTETLNQYREGGGLRGIFFTAPLAPFGTPYNASASLSTSWPKLDAQTHILRGPWWDGMQHVWDEFSSRGAITPLVTPAFGDPFQRADATQRWGLRWEIAALCLKADIEPGETVEFPIFIHWHTQYARLWGDDTYAPVRTYVGTQFADAWKAAEYTQKHFARLESESTAFRRAFYDSTLPPEALDAAGSQISILRSPTVLRLSDGAIYAWEGSSDKKGSCSGNCTHVWNYEQTLAFLFPSLERTMRRIDFGPNMRPDGGLAFRCDIPSGAAFTTSFQAPSCADGQMGNVMQAYRDWRFSGDDQFLRDLWPNIKRAIEYAWSSPTSWDPNKDGVMEGRQHNTYDIDFYGPNPMLSGLYLGALKAGQAMAHYLGDEEKAEEYGAIYQSGRRRIESELWNGAHFFQKVEVIEGIEVPANLRAPDSETPMPRHQFGAGCLADQVIGQWEAHVCGLGRILDEKKTKSALAEIYKHNFRRNMREIASVARVYALQDEAGLVLCTWPEGGRPALPFVYSDEVWTGIEYQVAAHMIYEGLVDEGLELVRAARARYDGARRNPWDEIECGHHYARALSSWSLILALSGAQFDGVEKSLTFTPRLAPPLRCFFSTGAAFGVFSRTKDSAEIEILGGQVDLLSFGVDATRETLAEPRRLKPGARWAIALR